MGEAEYKKAAIEGSIQKWEGIRTKVINKDGLDYQMFWSRCGYCDLYIHIGSTTARCNRCLLRRLDKGLRLCYHNFSEDSVASLALKEATKGNWEHSIRLIERLLRAMRNDLETVEECESSEDISYFSVGDLVRVKPSVDRLSYFWGDVKPGDIGIVKDPKCVYVDFPSQSNWGAVPEELEVVVSAAQMDELIPIFEVVTESKK